MNDEFFIGFKFVCLSVFIAFGVTIDSERAKAQSRKSNNWPSFLGSQRDGKSTETNPIKDWSEGKLKLNWSRANGESYSAPSIVDGQLFHFDRFEDKNVLFCLNVEDGKPVWQYSYGTDYVDMYGFTNGPRCSPVIHQDSVFVFGPEGELHAVHRKTGKKIWSVDTAKEFGVIQNFFGVGSTPLVYQDLLITMVGGSPEESQKIPRGQLDQVKPNGSGMVAFDLKTGKVKYKIGNELASYASPVVAKINDQDVGLGFCRGGLLGFEPKTGKQLFYFDWRAKKLETVNASTPIVFDQDKIFISECYELGSAMLQWNGSKLEKIWADEKGRDQAMMTHWNTPIEIDGFIYGCSGRHSGGAELRCIEAKSGKVKWSQPGLTRSSLTYIDNHFVLLSEYGKLQLIKVNPEKYEVVTEYKPELPIRLKYPCWAPPVICNGKMLILSKDKLFCFQLIESEKE